MTDKERRQRWQNTDLLLRPWYRRERPVQQERTIHEGYLRLWEAMQKEEEDANDSV